MFLKIAPKLISQRQWLTYLLWKLYKILFKPHSFILGRKSHQKKRFKRSGVDWNWRFDRDWVEGWNLKDKLEKRVVEKRYLALVVSVRTRVSVWLLCFDLTYRSVPLTPRNTFTRTRPFTETPFILRPQNQNPNEVRFHPFSSSSSSSSS